MTKARSDPTGQQKGIPAVREAPGNRSLPPFFSSSRHCDRLRAKRDRMHHWKPWLVAIVAPLLLTGCLWGPGKFSSTLALHRNGTFALDYKGEILMQLPEEKGLAAEPWKDDMAICIPEGKDAIILPESAKDVRPCTPAEIAKQR